MKPSMFSFARKEILRSSAYGSTLTANILLGFLALYFSAIFLILGFSIPRILEESFPEENLVSRFNSILFYYFIFDLIIRQLLQNLPTIRFKAFILHVKRKVISRYLLKRSIFHFLNLLPFFLFLPITFKLVLANYSPLSTLVWFLGLSAMVFSSHFLSIYLKWWINESKYGFFILLGVLIILFGLNYFDVVNFASSLGSFFNILLIKQVWLSVLIALLVTLYFLNDSYLKKNLYLNLVDKKQKERSVYDFSWISKFGEFGKFISLELRMIWRNKRPRSQVIVSLVFLLYGFMIYNQQSPPPVMIKMMFGLIMVSMFSLTIGQFFPAWHSGYYSLLMTQNIKIRQFLQSFYYLHAVVSFIYYLLSLSYMFFDMRIIYWHFAMLLYHLGINLNLLLFFGQFSKRAVELDRSAMFNYQGVSMYQMLLSIPLLIFPVLVGSLISKILGYDGAIIILGILGIAGIFLQPVFMNYLVKSYNNKKYQLIRNFKNS